jgi:hypothetical protein
MDEEAKAINSILKESLEYKDELIIFQALKRAIDYLSIERELTIILMFDRFDAYFPNLTAAFFTNLKILRNRAKYRFSAIFSLPRPLEDVLEPAMYAEFYEFVIGNTIYIPVNDPQVNEFRFEYLERASGKKTSEKIKNQIVSLTGGHGKLSRIALESILSEEKEPQSLSDFLLSKSAIKGAMLEIWNTLLPVEQRTLLTGHKDIQSDLYVVRAGLVANGKIQIPLLEEYLPNLPAPSAEKITLETSTNEIKLGEESLSEKLSASEFKLLRFLIQNKDRVCEKEEIIMNVWADTKTQEGVTDQALDQIVYRLRRKIETDPNNPIHIQTIKGRGYKFVE